MKVHIRCSRLLSLLVLSGTAVPALVGTPSPAADAGGCAVFSAAFGGYQLSASFALDAERHAVISPPACLRAGDLLSIRPLRLNPDEYLVLQKCNRADCTQAKVVRAWNSAGYMGPYPVLTDTIFIEEGVRYLLWMQRVHVPGQGIFSLIERDGPPLVFRPAGMLTAYGDSQRALRAALDRGPEPVKKATQEGSTFVATFEGGSVVRMKALRPGQ
jgi:hypothetical protein